MSPITGYTDYEQVPLITPKPNYRIDPLVNHFNFEDIYDMFKKMY